MLILDMHKAQKTEDVIECLRSSCNTEPVFASAGTASLLQAVDVVFNKLLRKWQQSICKKNWMIMSQVSASERSILFTKRVGQAWEELSVNKDMIVRLFEKCGISVPIDGSEDSRINIEGLEDYTVGAESDDEVADDETDRFEELDVGSEEIEVNGSKFKQTNETEHWSMHLLILSM